MSTVDICKLHILIVDDDMFLRNLIKRLLEEIGSGWISTAENGIDAFAALREAQPKVDLILLDLHMPNMSGFEFIKKLQSGFMPSFTNTPIIVISGNSDKSIMDSVRELGVGLYLLKPITSEQLETRINAAMMQRTI